MNTQIDLSELDASELALIAKMAHIDTRIRYEAQNILDTLIGERKSRKLQAAALTALDELNSLDAELCAGYAN